MQSRTNTIRTQALARNSASYFAARQVVLTVTVLLISLITILVSTG